MCFCVTWQRLIAALLLCLSSLALAKPVKINIDRYLQAPLTALPEQKNLLQQQVNIIFPKSVINIKQAINFTLQFTGYRLVNNKHMTKALTYLLNLPLPVINRHLGPITLKNALMTLAGPSYSLVIDPVHRLISFKIKRSHVHSL